MESSDIHVEQMSDVLEEGLARARSELLVVNPCHEAMRELVETVSVLDNSPLVRLFADEQSLKDVLEDFLVASRMADLVDSGRVEIRTLEKVPRASLLLTEEVVVTVVEGGDHIAGLTSTKRSFVTATYEDFDNRWNRAEAYSIRTPPLTHIRETMAEEIGEQATADMDRILDALETARGDGDGLDEVMITLLVAANNRELLYDISRWGEDIRLASKATFSRTKNELEEVGLIDTEKVPIEVGRPRLRLVLADSTLEDLELEEVVDHAETKLTQ